MSTEHKEERGIGSLDMLIELRLNDVDIKFCFGNMDLTSPDTATINDLNLFVSNAIREIIATAVSARNVFYQREKELVERTEKLKEEIVKADKDESLQEEVGKVAKERDERWLDEITDILKQEE